MFDRLHHQRIGDVLLALDAPLLRACNCLFGGGTAMALRFGEYRESADIDFLVSDIHGYRQLRERMTGAEGVQAIARDGVSLTQLREVRADHPAGQGQGHRCLRWQRRGRSAPCLYTTAHA